MGHTAVECSDAAVRQRTEDPERGARRGSRPCPVDDKQAANFCLAVHVHDTYTKVITIHVLYVYQRCRPWLGTGMLPSRSKKVTPGQQYGGRVLLKCMDVTSRRWKEGLTLQQQGKIIHVNYGQKYGQGEAVLGTWGAVAQVLGTFDSRVVTRTPVWDVEILVDPVENATLQAVWAELLSKGAGHRLYMQHLLNEPLCASPQLAAPIPAHNIVLQMQLPRFRRATRVWECRSEA